MHQFELDELAKERDRTEVKPVLPSFTLSLIDEKFM